jgi:uncharacterized protein YdeI (YjbR/CyaY-like superfamily)
MAISDYKTTHPKNRQQWRHWLEKNHQKSPGIWMIYYKTATGKRNFTYAEAVEEALCFGWIDSQPRKLDQNRAMLKFTPRKPKSIWSQLNKIRVRQLIKMGLMTDHGLVKITKAKKDRSWDALNSSNFHADNKTIPEDLSKAFRKNLIGKKESKNAVENFNNFPTGYRRRFLFWIESAKTNETRSARIKQTVLMAAANKKPGVKGFKL